MKNNKKKVIQQIRIMCDMNNIPLDSDFIEFVYNKHLLFYTNEIMHQLEKEYKGE